MSMPAPDSAASVKFSEVPNDRGTERPGFPGHPGNEVKKGHWGVSPI